MRIRNDAHGYADLATDSSVGFGKVAKLDVGPIGLLSFGGCKSWITTSVELCSSMVAEINPVTICEEDRTILFYVQEDQTRGFAHR